VVELRAADTEVVDFGAHEPNSDDDFPHFVMPLAQAVASGEVEHGVAICGSSVGTSVCTNRCPCSRHCGV
jgi:ribose 5-phosphate isomerase B